MDTIDHFGQGADAVAFRRIAGVKPELPTLMFLPGFRSTMEGDKANHLARRAQGAGLGFLSLDYRGHGLSGGRFEDFTLTDWLEDALAVLDRQAKGPVVLVGSSMGACLAVLVAEARPARIAGLVTVAAAPDFTQDGIAAAMTPADRKALARDGVWYRPSRHGDGAYPITQALLDDGRRHLVLTQQRRLAWAGPARLLHGMADQDVPCRQSLRLATALAGTDVMLTLVKDGDHRLSRPADLDLLWRTVDATVASALG